MHAMRIAYSCLQPTNFLLFHFPLLNFNKPKAPTHTHQLNHFICHSERNRSKNLISHKWKSNKLFLAINAGFRMKMSLVPSIHLKNSHSESFCLINFFSDNLRLAFACNKTAFNFFYGSSKELTFNPN